MALTLMAGTLVYSRWIAPAWSKSGQRTVSAGAVLPAAAASTSPMSAQQSGLTDKLESASDILKNGQLQANSAEARLVEIFADIEQTQFQQALNKSEQLVAAYPHFQLAQLVRGDLLRLRYQPSVGLGAVSEEQEQSAAKQLAALRTETQKRLNALRERPPGGFIPQHFVSLDRQTQYAVAVDASRSRMYVFQQTNHADQSSVRPEFKLIKDFFISVGKAGIHKQKEGDNKTPVGAYFVTSVKDKKTLPAFYGSGALPLGYPNPIDAHFGRTGSGIWLHGTPPNQFVRPTEASEGCVVLSNPDMDELLQKVLPRQTPVVIAEHLKWVAPNQLNDMQTQWLDRLQQWQMARASKNADDIGAWVIQTSQKSSHASTGTNLLVSTQAQLGIDHLSVIQADDEGQSAIVTFEETLKQVGTGVWRRQYWLANDSKWKLLQDQIIAGTPSIHLKRQVVVAAAPTSSAAPQVAMVSAPAVHVPTPSPTVAPAATKPEAQVQAATPKVPEVTPVASAEAKVNAQNEREIRQAVNAWAAAWSQKNVVAYFNAYDSTFDPPDGLNRKAWERERHDRITGKSKIAIGLSKMQVQIKNDTATVRFVQHYKADQLSIAGRKTLRLVQRNRRWLIIQENVNG